MSDATDRYLALTDLLLGAVHADGARTDTEEETVRNKLRELFGDPLPAAVEQRIEAFPAEGFDPADAARRFARAPAVDRRRLLELLAAVRDADEEIDLAEDEYMHRVAEALGMPRDEYTDLTLDYDVEVLRDTAHRIAPPPPPTRG